MDILRKLKHWWRCGCGLRVYRAQSYAVTQLGTTLTQLTQKPVPAGTYLLTASIEAQQRGSADARAQCFLNYATPAGRQGIDVGVVTLVHQPGYWAEETLHVGPTAVSLPQTTISLDCESFDTESLTYAYDAELIAEVVDQLN
jgi:hypothetical protein